MASQWTIPKLVTWRVKDWASCFLACEIPLDEGGVNNNGNSINNNNLTFKRIKRKMKTTKKKRTERKFSLSPRCPPVTLRHHHHHHLHLRSNVSPTSVSQHRRLSWPQLPVSDGAGFIDFCFDRQDGGFDVVKKEMGLSSEKSPRMVNRKIIYGDQRVGGTEKNNSSEIKGTEQDQKENTLYQETEDVCSDIHEKNEEEDDKSSGSNNSDEGRGSFAFPILGVEWMGSPVQMPKSDDLSPKKTKASCFRVPML